MREAKQAADRTQQIQYVQVTRRIVGKIAFLIESARANIKHPLPPGNKGIHVILISLRGYSNPDPQDKGGSKYDIQPSCVDNLRLVKQCLAAHSTVI
ncbi:hypothetical protein D3C73_1151970 [compost metagenome]